MRESLNHSGFADFVVSNPDFVQRWELFSKTVAPALSGPAPELLTPFSGTEFFASLDEGTRRALYLGFVRMNAEAFIILEQVLLAGFGSLTRPASLRARSSAAQAVRKLLVEELYHVAAFKKFLRDERQLAWPEKSVFLRSHHGLRNFLVWLARKAPFALALPAAKLESYTLYYAQTVRKAYGSWDANRWSKLHHLHSMDEGGHLPLQFDLYERAMGEMKALERVKTLIGTIVLFFVLQLLLVLGMSGVIADAFPSQSRVWRTTKAISAGRWVVRRFEPYQQARLNVRRSFEKRRPTFGRLLSFLHW